MEPEIINYLVGFLTEVGSESQVLLQTFLILIYNNNQFSSWVYEIYLYCDGELATEFVYPALEKYIQGHFNPLTP